MSKRIRIATIGTLPPKSAGLRDLDGLTERMAGFWFGKLEHVLVDEPDLVVVPEMCSHYEDLPKELGQEFDRHGGPVVAELFADLAREHGSVVVYPSLRAMPDGSWRNSATIYDRKGQIAGVYDKNHLVPVETTEGGVLCGVDAHLIECDFGRVGCALCFDLNFDELRLRYRDVRPDLLIFPSNYHGGLMQAYWAYSCRAHLVTACMYGPSSIISPQGVTLATTTSYVDFVTAEVNLDCAIAHLDENRDKMNRLKRAYGTGVTISSPDYLGSALITSERDDITAAEMITEFGIELLDDYFARSLAHHHDPANRARES